MLKYESQVVTYFADQITIKIVRNSIKQFQKWRITLSGDSRLVTTWDEICVQIQDEYSFHWDDYDDAVENHLAEQIKKLNEFELFALWLQSDEGMNYDEDEDESPDIFDHDIIKYLKVKIYWEAGNWSNKGIRGYLGY